MGKGLRNFTKGKNHHKKTKKRGNGKARPRECKKTPELIKDKENCNQD